jgi:2-(1,2-epoxy-1,2-dihydrophenyl)acetyl-CoA isomerase
VSEVRTKREAGVLTITFGDPELANAITWDLAREIVSVLNAVDEDRVVVLASEGKVFCSGADLALLQPYGHPTKLHEVRENIYSAFQALVRAIWECPVPVIARLQGPALGAGADLALACDLRVASTRSWLEESWIKLGTISALGGAAALTRAVGSGTALDLLLTARRLSALEALAGHVFQRVVEPDQLDAEVQSVTDAIVVADPEAVRSMKSLVRQDPSVSSSEDALVRGLALQGPLIAREEFAQRVAAIRRRLGDDR